MYRTLDDLEGRYVVVPPGEGVSLAEIHNVPYPAPDDAVLEDDSRVPRIVVRPWSEEYPLQTQENSAADMRPPTPMRTLRIPGLPEDATGWGLHERLPDRAGDAELPARLAAMYNRIFGLELATEFTPYEGGSRGLSISGGGVGEAAADQTHREEFLRPRAVRYIGRADKAQAI